MKMSKMVPNQVRRASSFLSYHGCLVFKILQCFRRTWS